MITSIKYRPSSFSILIIFILLMIVGISLLPLLNVQLTPSRSLPGLSVSYYWPDASARVIEQEVTSRLEGLFSRVKGIKEVSEDRVEENRLKLVSTNIRLRRVGLVPLALISADQTKYLIGICSSGAKYL